MRVLDFIFKCTLALVPFLSFTFPTAVNAAVIERLRERDYEAVQDFVNSKRTIPYECKDEYLKINCSVRTNILYRNEKQDGVNLRSGVDLGHWDFDAEFNLKLAYKCGKTYSKMRLQCYNPMGIETGIKNCTRDPQAMHGSGRCSDICLRDAWVGYHVLDCKCYVLDIEVGRRRLYSLFDSRIQFSERFDGAAFKLLEHVSDKSDVYLKGAVFLIDSRSNHCGYVTEIGIFNLYETMIDLKYSWILWDKFGTNRCGTRDPSGTFYNNSQWTMAYNFNPGYLNDRAKFYGAFLINHDACPLADINNSKENKGWYVGFIIGDEDLRDPGDWAFDINYQYVEAQAVSDRDVRGVKRGNVRRETFTRNNRGNANYKGMHIEGVYAITRCLSIDAMYQFSSQIENGLGGNHTYSKAEVDFIYSF